MTDIIFEILNSICFVAWLLEMLANIFAKTTFGTFNLKLFPPQFFFHGYLFSFFFLLDLTAICSLFPDVLWIANALGINDQANPYRGGGNGLSKTSNFVRIVRLVRFVRLYKLMSDRWYREELEKDLMEEVFAGNIDVAEIDQVRSAALRESRSVLGEKLYSSITQKVLALIVVIVIFVPVLTYSVIDLSAEYSIYTLHQLNMEHSKGIISRAFVDTVLNTTVEYTDEENVPYGYLIRLYMSPYREGYIVDLSSQVDSLRSQNKLNISFTDIDPITGRVFHTYGVFTDITYARLRAWYAFGLTLFVLAVLGCGAFALNSDAQRIVIAPIERMMKIVSAVSENPLADLPSDITDHDDDNDVGTYETLLLESTIQKITSK